MRGARINSREGTLDELGQQQGRVCKRQKSVVIALTNEKWRVELHQISDILGSIGDSDVNLEEIGLAEDRGFAGRGWICDKCGLIIERAADGWVQWREFGAESKNRKLRGERALGRDLQLVHADPASPHPIKTGEKYGCQFDDNDPAYMTMDLSLPEFLGPNGLMHLLDFIAKGSVETVEVLEMIKRLNVPGYEQARMHID